MTTHYVDVSGPGARASNSGMKGSQPLFDFLTEAAAQGRLGPEVAAAEYDTPFGMPGAVMIDMVRECFNSRFFGSYGDSSDWTDVETFVAAVDPSAEYSVCWGDI